MLPFRSITTRIPLVLIRACAALRVISLALMGVVAITVEVALGKVFVFDHASDCYRSHERDGNQDE